VTILQQKVPSGWAAPNGKIRCGTLPVDSIDVIMMPRERPANAAFSSRRLFAGSSDEGSVSAATAGIPTHLRFAGERLSFAITALLG
jgi:hypothetical protein